MTLAQSETCGSCGATGDDHNPIHVGWCKHCGREVCCECGNYNDPELGHSCSQDCPKEATDA